MPQYGTVWPHRPGPADDVGRVPDAADALLQDFYMKTRDKGALKLGRLLFPLYDFSLSSFRKEGRRSPRA